MSKKTLYLLGILLTIILGAYFSWKYCCDDGIDAHSSTTNELVNSENEGSTEVELNTPTITKFSIADEDGNFSINTDANFNFNKSSYNFNTPIDASIESEIAKLKTYFLDNENRNLDITGWYASDEENPSAFPNLGIARANSVKNYLVSKGLSASRLNIFGSLKEDLFPDGSLYRGPLSFSISQWDAEAAKKASEELELLGADLRANPLVLYFATGQNQIKLSTAQRQKIANIARYLDKVEGATTEVVGHTDNTGSRETNVRLGQERANFAKEYLTRNGISANKINATSKGPDEPIAANDTEEGRAKNRRTVITLNN